MVLDYYFEEKQVSIKSGIEVYSSIFGNSLNILLTSAEAANGFLGSSQYHHRHHRAKASYLLVFSRAASRKSPLDLKHNVLMNQKIGSKKRLDF